MSRFKQVHNTGLLNYFDITKDGIYSVQRKVSGEELASKTAGLEIDKVLPLIKSWLADREFKATCPWPGTPDANQHLPEMCYCKELFPCPNGDFILVLWKNDPADSEGYRGLILDEDGNPSTYLNNSSGDTDNNVVWGHPCYYWMIPERSLVVSIKFPDSKCDNDLFKKWIKYIVRFRLRIDGYNARQSTESSLSIRFSTPAFPENYNFVYKFETSIREFSTSAKYLESIASSTKNITIRNYATTSVARKKSEAKLSKVDEMNAGVLEAVSKLLELFRKQDEEYSKAEGSVSKRKVELMIEGTPSNELVDELLKYNNDMTDDDWSDVIFTTHDDNNISFKSHRLVEKVTMSRTGDPYSGEELYRALIDNRDRYLERFLSINNDSDIGQKAQKAS